MARRGFLRHRTAADWVIRLTLAAILAGAGYIAVSRIFASTMPLGAIAGAHALAPDNGQITAILAQTLLPGEEAPAAQARADMLAKNALVSDPTALPAIITLALNAQIRNQTALARRYFAYSEKLSRRNLETQLWASEDAVSRNDIPGALQHYDAALRTSDAAADLMFPVLASATVDPAIRAALIERIAAKPNWALSFIEYVAGNSATPKATAALFRGLKQARIAVPETAEVTLINALFAANFVEDAWSYYASTRRGADRRSSRDPSFMADPTTPLPFDWMTVNDAGVSASIQRGEKGGMFDFAVPAGIGATVLQQIQMLPAGNYRIEGHSIGIDQPKGSRPYWTIMCRGGSEYGRVDIPNSAEHEGAFSGQFTIAADCPLQVLAFVARPSDMVSGVSGQIDKVLLRPVR